MYKEHINKQTHSCLYKERFSVYLTENTLHHHDKKKDQLMLLSTCNIIKSGHNGKLDMSSNVLEDSRAQDR
jgi:hypothetical protein